MTQLTDDQLVTHLQARTDEVLPAMSLELTTVRAAGRRRRQARRWSAAGSGVLAVIAVGGLVANSSVLARTDQPPAGGGTARVAAERAPGVVTLAVGVTAATRVDGDGTAWDTGLTAAVAGGHDPLVVSLGTSKDLQTVLDATGQQVDHALRVTANGGQAAGAMFVIAWPDGFSTSDVTRVRPHPQAPWAMTMSNAQSSTSSGTPRVSHVAAGALPIAPEGEHAVLFSTTPMTDPAGDEVHAVEVPTFADPNGSGAQVYVLSADRSSSTAGPDGIYYVSDDGTVLDPEGRCSPTAESACWNDANGLDVHAELMGAIGR